MNLILGSQSPRRKEILNFFSIPFVQAPSHFDESQIEFNGDPRHYAMTLSQKKAESLQGTYLDSIILGADTVVFCKGKIYNKPIDREEAKHFLSILSGEWHSVFTGLTLSVQGRLDSVVEETRILFHTLSSNQIDLYLDHMNYRDKAGGYAIQQGGSIVIKKIEGCYYNAMGLPIGALKDLLARAGVDLWQHLKIL